MSSTLHVAADNAPAYSLYCSLGYVEDGLLVGASRERNAGGRALVFSYHSKHRYESDGALCPVKVAM